MGFHWPAFSRIRTDVRFCIYTGEYGPLKTSIFGYFIQYLYNDTENFHAMRRLLKLYLTTYFRLELGAKKWKIFVNANLTGYYDGLFRNPFLTKQDENQKKIINI